MTQHNERETKDNRPIEIQASKGKIDLTFLVNRAIELDNAENVFKLVPHFAAISTADYDLCRERLKQHFKRRLLLSRLDEQVADTKQGKQAPTPGEEIPEEETAELPQVDEMAQALYRYGYTRSDIAGLGAIRFVRGREVVTPVCQAHVDVIQKRHIHTVPDIVGDKPREHGVVLVAQLSTLHDESISQTMEIHRSDMLSRQPKFFQDIQAVKPPHIRQQTNFVDALESLAMFAPIEDRFDACGLVQTPAGLTLLHPQGGGVTSNGIDARYQVQLPFTVANRLTTIKYGWQRESTPNEQVADYQTLMQVRDIAPGAPGYGEVLIGTHGFAPMSQLCDTGGVLSIVHGLTGSYKSATSRLLLQGYSINIYGRTETSTINLREGASTSYAIEQVLYYLGGMVAHCDDGLKGNNTASKDVERFYKMLSTIGGHAVTKQGGKRGVWGQGEGGFGIEPYPRGSVIFTVEILPTSEGHASDLARFVVVSLGSSLCVDTSLLSHLQGEMQAQAMNRATCSYIKWLLPRMPAFLKSISDREEFYRSQEVHTRTPTSYAKLETGIDALLQYGVSINAHTESEAQSLLQMCRKNLLAVALAQKGMMGIEEQSSSANDTGNVFYTLLGEAMRDGKLTVSDSTYRPITEFTSEVGKEPSVVGHRLQPPLFLADESIPHGLNSLPDGYGWKWNENTRVYDPRGVEAGVLKWDGAKPVLQIYTKDFKEILYKELKRIAGNQDIPLAGYNEIISRLKERGKLTTTNPTNLHGRNSQTGRTYLIDMTPEEEVEPSPVTPMPPDNTRACVEPATTPLPSEDKASTLYADAMAILDPYSGNEDVTFILANGEYTYAGVVFMLTELLTTGDYAPVETFITRYKQVDASPVVAPVNVPPEVQPVIQQEASPTPKRKTYITAYADIQTGIVLLSSGETVTIQTPVTLASLLDTIPHCNRIFICGELPPDYGEWLIDSAIYENFSTNKRGHYLSSSQEDEHVARYTNRVTGDETEIRTIFSWFGDTGYTVHQARAAMDLLNQYLANTFPEGTKAYGTPALTFSQTWQRLNRIKGKSYPVLSEETRVLIRSTLGQGRIEHLTPKSAKKLPGLYYYDGIFMYSALSWDMPSGVEAHDHENRYEGNKPARYRIRYTVPGDWQHIGFFMTPKQQGTGLAIDSESWCYPGEEYQGRTFETWADGAEVDALVQYYADIPQDATTEQKRVAKQRGMERGFTTWNITILERIVFAKDATHKPLDEITRKLTTLRDKVEQDASHDPSRADIYKLVRGAIRNILLHGIGSFNRSQKDISDIRHEDEPAPDGATFARRIDNHRIVYTIPQALDEYTQQLEHPEWAHLIWARCRARMTRAALSIPREQIVAVRTDAIAVTTKQPQWENNTRRGELRRKWAIEKSLPAPRSFEELDKLVDRHVKGDK